MIRKGDFILSGPNSDIPVSLKRFVGNWVSCLGI